MARKPYTGSQYHIGQTTRRMALHIKGGGKGKSGGGFRGSRGHSVLSATVRRKVRKLMT